MGYGLRLDLESWRVEFHDGAHVVWEHTENQWVEFYARLVLDHVGDSAGDQWIAAVDLEELQSWKRKHRFSSIGKVVARHISQLERLSAPCAVVFPARHRTKHWRLNASVETVEVLPSVGHLKPWLVERGMGRGRNPLATPDSASLNWLRHMTHAHVAFHHADLTRAHEEATAALQHTASSPLLIRAAGVLVIRAVSRQGLSYEAREKVEGLLAEALDAAVDAEESQLWGHDALGGHFRSRLAAIEAIQSDAANASSQIKGLRRRLERVETAGDVAAEALLHNAIGLLALRTGDFAAARSHLASGLLIAVSLGDLYTLDGALFNLGLCLIRSSPAGAGISLGAAEELLKLSHMIEGNLHVGGDSAQTQILLARLMIHFRRFEEAENFLSLADSAVSKTRNNYDHACARRARAKLLWGKYGSSARLEVMSLLEDVRRGGTPSLAIA